jgi:hypothetical protein
MSSKSSKKPPGGKGGPSTRSTRSSLAGVKPPTSLAKPPMNPKADKAAAAAKLAAAAAAVKDYSTDTKVALKALNATGASMPLDFRYYQPQPGYDPSDPSQLNEREKKVSTRCWGLIKNIIDNPSYKNGSTNMRQSKTMPIWQPKQNCMQHAANRWLANIIGNQFNLNTEGRNRLLCVLLEYITNGLNRVMTTEELPHIYELLRIESELLRIESGETLTRINIASDDELILPINNADNFNALNAKLLEIDTSLGNGLNINSDVNFINHNINYIIINLLLQDNMMSWMSDLCDDKNQNDYTKRNNANNAMRNEKDDNDVGIGIIFDKSSKKELKYFYKISDGHDKKIPGHSVNVVGFIKENGVITYLKIRGSWKNCDTGNGFVLIAMEGVKKHLYNAIITENIAGGGGMMTKRKQKQKSKKMKRNKRKQTRRRLKK